MIGHIMTAIVNNDFMQGIVSVSVVTHVSTDFCTSLGFSHMRFEKRFRLEVVLIQEP